MQLDHRIVHIYVSPKENVYFYHFHKLILAYFCRGNNKLKAAIYCLYQTISDHHLTFFSIYRTTFVFIYKIYFFLTFQSILFDVIIIFRLIIFLMK